MPSVFSSVITPFGTAQKLLDLFVNNLHNMDKNKEFKNPNPQIRAYHFKPVKYFPNSTLPLLIYKKLFNAGKQAKKAASQLQQLMHKHNWRNAWTNGIYFFHHYHSNTHECLAIAAGTARVIFGGPGGRSIMVKKGDLLVIPAGLAHKCTKASEDFVCVGAYPGGKQYDTNLGTKEELEKAKPRLKKLTIPAKDPAFGKEGFLNSFWK